MKKLYSLLLFFVFALGSVFACTTLIVGKDATNDASVIMARSEDYKAISSKRLFVHSETELKKIKTFRSPGNDFQIQFPEHPLKYFAISDPGEEVSMPELGINSAGLAITATESIANSVKVLKIDPYVKNTGIGELSIPSVILPTAKTPKEAVLMLGCIIEKYGASEGYGVGFANNKEAWYLETASGHRWCAARIPDNSYFITANCSRIQEVNLEDKENFLASPDLIEFAVKNKLYNPEKDSKFNFRKTFARICKKDIDYNYYRVFTVLKTFNPEFNADYKMGDFPTFMVPENKISLNDTKSIMRNHYRDTFYNPYITKNTKEPYRPISVFRTVESHVICMRSWLPQDIGNVAYLALGMSALSIYVPFYQGITEVPESYTVGGTKACDDSAYWTYRKLQTLGMTNFPTYGGFLQKAISKYEDSQQSKINAFEKEYKNIRNSSESKTNLNKFNMETASAALNETKRLTNIIFTHMTLEIDAKYPFKGF